MTFRPNGKLRSVSRRARREWPTTFPAAEKLRSLSGRAPCGIRRGLWRNPWSVWGCHISPRPRDAHPRQRCGVRQAGPLRRAVRASKYPLTASGSAGAHRAGAAGGSGGIRGAFGQVIFLRGLAMRICDSAAE